MIKIWVKKISIFIIFFIAVFVCASLYCGEVVVTHILNAYSAPAFEQQAEPADISDISNISEISDIPVIPDISETPKVLEVPDVSENAVIAEILKIAEPYNFDDYFGKPGPVLYTKKKQTREILISAVGDLTLGSEYRKSYRGSFYEYYDLYGPGYFCENVVPVFNASDCTVANLECALTDNQSPAIVQRKEYNYKGYTKYTDIIKAADIDIVNIANNHSYDFSQTGYDDTRAALDNAGIGYFGNGIVLIKEINGIKVGFAGSVGTYWPQDLKNALDYMKANGVEIKIISFHWGVMDQYIANANQVAAAHLAIDNGADLVIGHHPHVLQGIELYKGKYIAYSIGNFIFDGKVISDVENRSSIIFQIRFSLSGTEIVDTGINIIPVITTSSMSRNNFKPYLADGNLKESILNKIKARSAHYPVPGLSP